MSFVSYLKQKGLALSSVRCYSIYIERFTNWLESEEIHKEDFTYNDVLDFMRYCHHQGVTKRTVHSILCVVRHYCNYLISEGKRSDNPAAGLFIKGLVRKLPSNLLSFEELEELFKQYSVQLHVDASRKIMLGLMIYQGMTVGELMRLQGHHIRLKEGKIFIKETKRSNERLLSLQAVQMVQLQNYLHVNKGKAGSVFIEPVKKEVSAFNINNRIQHMFKQLRQLNEKVMNPKQVRSSVITHWLRQHNLRQVQYMAGHKYVSSTERYQTNNLDDLQNELKQHHPMQ